MEWTTGPAMEEERCAPARARGAKNGGGAAGPSTVKGKRDMVKNFEEMVWFSLPPHAGLGDAPKGASPGLGGGAKPFFSVVLCCQNDEFCEFLLAMPSFQCIGGGSVPPPMACRTLGRAARQKARHLALAEALILFFSVVLCWQNFKICECLLARPSFQCIGGGSVPPPMQLPDAGPGGAPKGASLGLGGGTDSLFFCRTVLAKL